MGNKNNNKRRRRAEKKISLVFADQKETFWEVDKVLDRRSKDGEIQYLVQWRGLPRAKATWEPSENLCDSAHEEARMLDQVLGMKNSIVMEEMSCDASKDTKGNTRESTDVTEVNDSTRNSQCDSEDDDDDSSTVSYPSHYQDPCSVSLETPLEDGRWRWNEEEQLEFRDVERINVNDDDARQRVTDARLNGTPVVLVGHVGWANFAKRWLNLVDHEGTVGNKSMWLDLSKGYEIDITKMINDIGNEVVPVLKKNYDEQNPLEAKMKISAFLKTCWPDAEGKFGTREKLYLHQWQFPLSKTGGRKLCHQNKRLPNRILGEDLLRYWLDLPQCKRDSALQYLFMGRDGTMSKLHHDNGGLAISIAPIVGIKECVLLHRLDGATCFYHLDASLDCIDLEKYPLMSQARLWRTSVRPGEILLMPQGTYHQCRNITPCLSYSRFHLDTLNLLPFLQSMFDGDAKEIEHAEVIWNCSNELISVVDNYVEQCRMCLEKDPQGEPPELTDDIEEKVFTLRALRNICRETVIRLRSLKVKGSKQNDDMSDIGSHSEWKRMVDDIDDCVHHFRFRNSLNIPPRSRKKRKTEAQKPTASKPSFGAESERIDSKGDFDSNMEAALAFHQLRSPLRSTLPRPKEENIQVDNLVIVKLQKREILGKILKIEEDMNAAYLSYDGFPSIYDEYQPFETLRMSVGGESLPLVYDQVKMGTKVVNRWGEGGEEYRAVVVKVYRQRFFFIRVQLSPTFHIDRWFTIQEIVSWAELDNTAL